MDCVAPPPPGAGAGAPPPPGAGAGAPPPPGAPPLLRSSQPKPSPPIADHLSHHLCEEGVVEMSEWDFGNIESPSPQPAKNKGNDNKISNKTLHDKMMALMALQSASGHFAENKMIGDIVGKPLEDLKAEVPDSKPETMESWLTAVVVAFLEVKCQKEKDLWGMSVEKAKTVVIDQTFVQLAKEMIAQI